MSSDNLMNLMTFDGQRRAAQYDATADVFKMEPGDMTHYELRIGARGIAQACVGDIYAEQSGLFVSRIPHYDDDELVVAIYGRVSEYTRDALTYFCKLALGIPCDEPAAFTQRRRWAAEATAN